MAGRSDMSTQRDEDAELDLILSRGRLTGPAADRLRERVLEQVVPRRPAWWRRWLVVVPTLAAATAAVVLFVRPGGDTADGVRAKGAAAGISVELACSGGSPAACPRGARLSVAVLGA